MSNANANPLIPSFPCLVGHPFTCTFALSPRKHHYICTEATSTCTGLNYNFSGHLKEQEIFLQAGLDVPIYTVYIYSSVK